MQKIVLGKFATPTDAQEALVSKTGGWSEKDIVQSATGKRIPALWNPCVSIPPFGGDYQVFDD